VATTRVSLFVCLALATGLGTWYLGVRLPDNQWRLADRAGQGLMDQTRYIEAERQFAMAAEAGRLFGDHDPRRAVSLFHLAQALAAQSKNAEAIPLLEQSAAISEHTLGPDHPDVKQVREYHAALLRQSHEGHGP
jgi:tetratricopeptide (TPR) repeat protein